MPQFSRLSGKKVILSDAKTSEVVRSIRDFPNLRVPDYQVMLAGKGVYVTTNEINLTLECTGGGKTLVRKGLVSYTKSRGKAPSWTRIRGAVVNPPAADYKPAVFLPQVIADERVDGVVREDANHTMALLSTALSRPSGSVKQRFNTIREITEAVVHAAYREDSRVKEAELLSIKLERAELRLTSAENINERMEAALARMEATSGRLLTHVEPSGKTTASA